MAKRVKKAYGVRQKLYVIILSKNKLEVVIVFDSTESPKVKA